MPGREKGHVEAKRDRLPVRVNPHVSRKGQQKEGVPGRCDSHSVQSQQKQKATPGKIKGSCIDANCLALSSNEGERMPPRRAKKALTHILYKLIFAVNVVNVMQFNAM